MIQKIYITFKYRKYDFILGGGGINVISSNSILEFICTMSVFYIKIENKHYN